MKKNVMRRLAAMFRGGMKALLGIPYMWGKRNGQDDFVCNLMIPIAEAVEQKSNSYVTYNLYPKCAEKQNVWCYGRGIHAEEVAIIMQGPIRIEENFTLETVRYYAKIYPGVKVIVSTWKEEDQEQIRLLKEEKNCEVILNEKPLSEGVAHINYQMFSSLAGVKKAEMEGVKYALKTRSDSRITMPGILEQLVELVGNYEIPGTKRCRVVLFNAYLFYPYMDFGTYYFGRVEELQQLFDCYNHPGEVEKDYAERLVKQGITYREMFTEGCALNWALKNYFSKIHNEKVKCQLEDWWTDIGNYTICLPVAFLRPLWVKYDYNHEESDMVWLYRREIMGSAGVDNSMIDFAMWNWLKNGERPDAELYNRYLDMAMR